MKYVKTNKIIAFILSMVMILSNILPNISSDVFGLGSGVVNEKNTEPIIEYSDSGQTEPERTITGTDIDNFKFSLKYGTIEDKVENDTLFVKDTSSKINATLRIEYTGNQVYDAGDLTMTFNYPTGIWRNNPDYNMLSDVGAELKGSGSGRGDWYYEKTNGKLTFTNKSATTGSFTSSIEIVLDMPSVREVINKYSSTMSATFSVNGFNSILASKTLSFSTEMTHDEFSLTKISPRQYVYYTYTSNSEEYVVSGYKLNDYYIVNVDFSYIRDYFCRGSYITDTIIVPEDCIIIESGSNVFIDNKNINYKNTNDKTSLTLAIPKANYTVDNKLSISWNKKADFFDTHETWEDTINTEIEILDCKINITNASTSSGKDASKKTMYFSELKKNKGSDFYWTITLNKNSHYNRNHEQFAPNHTEIIDETTALYKEQVFDGRYKVRDFEEDEYYLTYLRLLPKYNDIINECNVQIYAKKFSESEYTLIKDFTYNNEDITIDLDVTKRYANFKIIIDGNWVNSNITNAGIKIIAGVHCELFNTEECKYIGNKASYSEILNSGDTLSTSLPCFIKLLTEEVRVFAEAKSQSSSGSLKDSKIVYNPTFRGGYYFDGYSKARIHKTSFDITFPSYVNLDFSNGIEEQISLYGKIYKENDDTLISEKTDGYYDLDYNITQDGNTKKLTVNIQIKDGYYRTDSSFSFSPKPYISFDIYSLLLNIGKLPSYFDMSETVYNAENFPGYVWTTTKKSSYIRFNIPSLAGNTYQGVEKFVNTGSGFTKDLSATTPGGDYSYKLRIAGGETTLDNIVLYDNLEEAYGDNKYWKGTFNGLDTTLLDMICEGEDYTYTVYYSKDKNQKFDLSDTGWVKEADWADALADVKSIAVDLGGIRLEPKSLAYVIVNMKAPDNTNPGLKAYNSYAADYNAYDPSTDNLMETIKALPSNTTEVIYNKNITYTVNKVWDGKASDSVEIKLFANGTEKETITLNADNKWTHTFTDLPALDDNFSPIEYTVEETALKLYNASYETVTDKDGNITTTIVNTRVPDIYTITKVWNINSEKIKLNVKTENGYDAEYDYINILDIDGSVLERIDFEKLGLVISKNEYKTDKTYTAEVHMKDGKVYKTSVNMDKFTPTPIECDLYVDGKVVDTFTLNKENDWKYTVTPSEKDNGTGISLYSDDVIIDDDIIIVDPGDNPGGDDWEIHVYEDLDGVCSICGKTKEAGNHETIIDAEDPDDKKENDNTGNENKDNPTDTGDNNYHYHEYVDDNGICSICGKTKDEGDHDKGVVHPKDEDDGVPVLPEIPTEPHSVKEKTKGNWKSTISFTETDNHIDYTITNDIEHEIEITTITVSNPEPPVDTGNSNYLWIYLITLGIGFAGILISRKKKAII